MKSAPRPRECLLKTDLTRPDWTRDSGRDPNLIWLDKNENTDPQMMELTKSIMASIPKEALYTYPNIYPLYEKISKYTKLPMSQHLITAGSDGVIRHVFEAFINQGDKVLYTSPTFAMYSVYCKIFGAQEMKLEYKKGDNGPVLELETILESLRQFKPKLFCLPNPDSPTGTVFSLNEIKSIAEVAEQLNTIVLIDEAYFEFYQTSAAPLISQYNNIIIARTFAKGWGLAGLRIGYALASHEITQYLHKIRPMYEVNTFAVYFMIKMMDYEEEMWKSVKRLNDGKCYFKNAMQKMGFKTLETHGNFQHISFGDKADRIHQNLSKVVLYRNNFSEECLKGFSRFSAATKEIYSVIIPHIERALL